MKERKSQGTCRGVSVALLVLIGCGGVRVEDGSDGDGGGATSTSSSSSSATVGPVGPTSTTSGLGGDGQGTGAAAPGSGGDGQGGVGGAPPQDVCSPGCGAAELCGGAALGRDEDCDGEVDEGCPCVPGEVAGCFAGDSSALARSPATCARGTMACDEDGVWGGCEGGVHATDACLALGADDCRPIRALPYARVDLTDGLGDFGDDADTGTWTVTCPEGTACFDPSAPGSSFRPLQAGLYEVEYEKVVDGVPSSCTFPLVVGAPGLRVDLAWDYPAGTDLDLHVFQPGITGVLDRAGVPYDCTWDNCTVDDFSSEQGVEWFPLTAPQGEPIAWSLDPVEDENDCYAIPRGLGEQWRTYGRGCHNPRRDLDNVSCDPLMTNPDDPAACVAEGAAIDVMPLGQWTRIGVVDYNGTPNEPILRVHCDGDMRALLGPEGYAAPVELAGEVGWLAIDVAFVDDGCGGRTCIVAPIVADGGQPLIGPLPLSGPALPAPPEP